MINKKINILIIPTWYPSFQNTGGTFVQMQAKALAKKGISVTILLLKYYTPQNFLKNFFNIFFRKNKQCKNVKLLRLLIIIPPSIFYKNPIEFQKKFILKYCYLRVKIHSFFHGKCDIIHHHGILSNCYITEYLSKKLQIFYILTEHSPFSGLNIKFHNPFDNLTSVKNFIHNAKEKIAVSDFYAKKYEKIFNVPFISIPNLVEDEFLSGEIINLKTNSFVFLSIGDLVPVKNHALLINSFYKSFAENTAIKLYIVGTGSLKNKLQNLVKELKIENQVSFLGYVDRKNLKSIINEAKVLVVSSYFETFSVVIIEAFFRGKPVVATKCGGPEELINHTNGILCNANDIDALKIAMENMYQNYNQYNKQKIRTDAISKFSEKTVVEKLKNIYQKIIKN